MLAGFPTTNAAHLRLGDKQAKTRIKFLFFNFIDNNNVLAKKDLVVNTKREKQFIRIQEEDFFKKIKTEMGFMFVSFDHENKPNDPRTLNFAILLCLDLLIKLKH